jgi:hypothetical protein
MSFVDDETHELVEGQAQWLHSVSCEHVAHARP